MLVCADEQSFCRGVAAVDGPITGSASDQLCVGASNGDIFIFTVEDDTVEFSRTIRFHTSAVTSMASSVDFVACADDDGQISLWTAQGMAKHCAFDGFGHPCTAVATRRDLVIGSYSTGHIRLFSSRTQSITAEIMAHSRCINALELHPSHMTVRACRAFGSSPLHSSLLPFPCGVHPCVPAPSSSRSVRTP